MSIVCRRVRCRRQGHLIPEAIELRVAGVLSELVHDRNDGELRIRPHQRRIVQLVYIVSFHGKARAVDRVLARTVPVHLIKLYDPPKMCDHPLNVAVACGAESPGS